MKVTEGSGRDELTFFLGPRSSCTRKASPLSTFVIRCRISSRSYSPSHTTRATRKHSLLVRLGASR